MKPSTQIKLIEDTITALHACQNDLTLSSRASDTIDSILIDLRLERHLAQSKLGTPKSIIDHILSWQ